MFNGRMIVSTGLLLLAGSIHSVAWAAEPVVDANLPLAEQLQQVGVLLNSEDYSEITSEGRAEVRQAIARITTIMGERVSIDELNPAQRIEVLNQQEVINTAMNRAAADSRVSCERHRPIGSNRPVRVCMTVAERRRAREKSDTLLGEGAGRQQPFDPNKL